jgi:FK506-binding nuclear protein
MDDISYGSEDELDDIEEPRIQEIDSEDDEAVPKLVAADSKKGKNKRPAQDEEDGLDELISKDAKAADAKLSKKQLKKLKNNKGEAVATEETKPQKEATKSDKKVQFAKNLEQGPTGSAEKAKQAGAKSNLGVKVVQGVTVDDRKIGSGRAVKNGDTVGVRYIGKTDDGKVFDGKL